MTTFLVILALKGWVYDLKSDQLSLLQCFDANMEMAGRCQKKQTAV
jgi:hypothetical protein